MASMANDKYAVDEGLLRTALENSFGVSGFTLTGDSSSGWTVDVKGQKYTVQSNGSLTENEDVNVGSVSIDNLGTTFASVTTLVEDKSNPTQTFYLPAGFKIATDSADTVDEGIVIEDESGNQFVWVPVPDVIWDGTTTISSGSHTPMATTFTYPNSSVLGTLYKGLLYDIIWETNPSRPWEQNAVGYEYKSDYDVGTTSYREPSLITGDSSVMWAPMPIAEGQTDVAGSGYDKANFASAGNFATAAAFGKQLQEDYNAMIASVDNYKGFYVGRFETGIETNTDETTYKKTVSKKATTSGKYPVTTADATAEKGNTWYGLYKMQKEFAATSGKVRSSMIWGSQYDAMMNWMAKTGKDVIIADSNKYNTAQTTGSKTEDLINNVFDLYGCHYEWTLETHDISTRAQRGGYYNNSFAPVRRNFTDSTNTGDYNGSRLTLYIVE